MKSKILGIHHITAMASDAQKNVDFYVNILGLRFVKKSINQDAPDIYHLYYGDEVGSPGTAITFFPFGRAARGTRGNGEISHVAFAVPTTSLDFWISHLAKNGIHFDGPVRKFSDDVITFLDPDGMIIDLVFSDKQELRFPWKKSTVPVEHAIKRFYGVTMNLDEIDPSIKVLQDLLGARPAAQSGNYFRFLIGEGNDEAAVDIIIDPKLPHARQSAGSVHHIAWRVKDFSAHEEWRLAVERSGLSTTEIIDRFYFHSIYFREPGGVLYEIATDNPGFTVDETLEELGSHLKLPPWYEIHRTKIEQALPPIVIPGSQKYPMKELTILSKGIAPHNDPKLLFTGEELSNARAAMIMVHGRGATAESILDLSRYFMFEGVSYIAPQANESTWYPHSFLMPIEQNEPGLSSALQKLTDVVDHVIASGIPEQKIMLLGFSQGASLSLEWTARNAKNITAVFGLSGGLIGPPGTKREYPGSFKNTTVFLGCSDVDFHIPKARVIESADVFKRMDADVTMKLYPNLPHTVNDDEIAIINRFVKNLLDK